MRNSSLRTLLPPNARPVRSSLFTKILGPPKAREKRGHSCKGVGRTPSSTLGISPIFAFKISGSIIPRAMLFPSLDKEVAAVYNERRTLKVAGFGRSQE